MNVSVQPKLARLIPLALLVGSAGCGLDNLGVRAVEFNLQPALSADLPVDYDRVGAMMASGHVEADVIEGHGTLTVTGLPTPPPGFDYMATLMFAHEEREGLPGHDAAGADEESHDEEEGLENLSLGVLLTGDGAGSQGFSADGIDDHVLGGLRAAMIMLMPSGMGGMNGMGGMILFGEVGQDPDAGEGSEPAEGGGHAHGA